MVEFAKKITVNITNFVKDCTKISHENFSTAVEDYTEIFAA